MTRLAKIGSNAREDHRKRYDRLKSMVRKHGAGVIHDLYVRNKLHHPPGSSLGGAEEVLDWYIRSYRRPLSGTDEEAQDYAIFMLEAFCRQREKNHPWPMNGPKGLETAERAHAAWMLKCRARGAIQEASG